MGFADVAPLRSLTGDVATVISFRPVAGPPALTEIVLRTGPALLDALGSAARTSMPAARPATA